MERELWPATVLLGLVSIAFYVLGYLHGKRLRDKK